MHRYVTRDISTRHTPAMAAMRRAWSALRAPRGLRSFTPAIKGFRAGNFISVPGTRLRPMSSAAESLVEVKGATPEPEKSPWTSTASRDEAVARRKNLRISPRKLNDICRLVRGLSCAEAIAQMKLSDRPKAKFVEKVIAAAITNGINNFNMDAERLYVAEAVVGQGQHRKKMRYHAKGRFGRSKGYHAHLTIKVKEQPWSEDEVRIGRRGRKLTVIEAQRAIHEEISAKYESILEQFEED
ncbi:hypothetical protein AAMO2058_000526900 [Amorphochlora amoebiformis]